MTRCATTLESLANSPACRQDYEAIKDTCLVPAINRVSTFVSIKYMTGIPLLWQMNCHQEENNFVELYQMENWQSWFKINYRRVYCSQSLQLITSDRLELI